MQKKKGFDTLHFVKTLAAIVGLMISLIFLFFIAFVFVSFVSLIATDDGAIPFDGNVAVIPITGSISTTGSSDLFQKAGLKSQKIVDWIKDAEEDDDIKAILFDIDSPGGTPVGSAEIAGAIKKAKKPTVSVIHEMGTSGAYWVASATHTIFANRMSLVGSIGVRGSYLEYAGLMKDYNVTYRRLVAGKYKDITSKYKEMTPEEQAIVQEKLDKLHDIFITEVAKNRNMSIDKVREIANGYAFIGQEALELGLVDMIGGKEEAKDYLEKMLNKTIEFKEYKAKKSLFDVFSMSMNDLAYTMGEGMGSVFLRSTHDELEVTV